VKQLATERPDINVQISWKPFLLRPNMPEDGTPKSPATPDNPRVGTRLKNAGLNSNINFTGLTDRAPNSIEAHTLLKYYENHPLQNNLMEIIFRHYFTDGKYPDSNHLLEALNESQMPNIDKAIEFSKSNENRQLVRQEALSYSQQGISGVPYFIFNKRPTFSGAQPPSSMKQEILKALAMK